MFVLALFWVSGVLLHIHLKCQAVMQVLNSGSFFLLLLFLYSLSYSLVCIQAKWLSRPGPLYRFHLACVACVRKGGKGERRACIAPDFSPSLSFYGLRRRLDFTGMKRLRIPPSSCKFAGIHLYTLKSHISYLELSALVPYRRSASKTIQILHSALTRSYFCEGNSVSFPEKIFKV